MSDAAVVPEIVERGVDSDTGEIVPLPPEGRVAAITGAPGSES